MLTPARLSMTARLLLVLLAPLLLFFAYSAPVNGIFGELAWLATCGYFLTLLALLAWPWRRKVDLFGVVAFFMIAQSTVRVLATGQPLMLLGLVTGIAGISCVYLPNVIERLRTLSRQYGHETFEIIKAEERRRDMQRRRVRRRKEQPDNTSAAA